MAEVKKSKMEKSYTDFIEKYQDMTFDLSNTHAGEVLNAVIREEGGIQDLDDLCDAITEAIERLRYDGYSASAKKSKVAKREWEEDNYDPLSSEDDIISAFHSEYGNKEVIKLEYVGTDWAMGSQYWVMMYDEGEGTLFDENRRYSVMTVIDWTYDNPDRGITFNWGAYQLPMPVAEDVFAEKVQRESSGTKKMKRPEPKTTLSFEDNVNKLRKSNYARTGNINSVRKG